MTSETSESSLSLVAALVDYEAALKAVYHDGAPLKQEELNQRISHALQAFDAARSAMVAQDLRILLPWLKRFERDRREARPDIEAAMAAMVEREGLEEGLLGAVALSETLASSLSVALIGSLHRLVFRELCPPDYLRDLLVTEKNKRRWVAVPAVALVLIVVGLYVSGTAAIVVGALSLLLFAVDYYVRATKERTGTVLTPSASERIRADLAQLDRRRQELEALTTGRSYQPFRFRIPPTIAPAYDLVAAGGTLAPTQQNVAILREAIDAVKILRETFRSIKEARDIGQIYDALEAADELIQAAS